MLTIGGIAHTKGQHDVIKALPAIARAIGPVSYQLVGEIRDDSYFLYLHRLAAALGVSDAVVITPDLDDQQMHQALDASDVYVQPSHEDGFCLAYAEAAARVGRLVGADTGAIKAINADDPAARTVEPRRPGSIAAAVIELATTTLPSDLLAKRAERLSRRFSCERYVAEHEQLFARQKP